MLTQGGAKGRSFEEFEGRWVLTLGMCWVTTTTTLSAMNLELWEEMRTKGTTSLFGGGKKSFSHLSFLVIFLSSCCLFPDLSSVWRRNPKYLPPPSIELCPAPFLGLTVQPCRGEPCGSAARFAFLTVVVIWIENKSHFFSFPESMPVDSTMFNVQEG